MKLMSEVRIKIADLQSLLNLYQEKVLSTLKEQGVDVHYSSTIIDGFATSLENAGKALTTINVATINDQLQNLKKIFQKHMIEEMLATQGLEDSFVKQLDHLSKQKPSDKVLNALATPIVQFPDMIQKNSAIIIQKPQEQKYLKKQVKKSKPETTNKKATASSPTNETTAPSSADETMTSSSEDESTLEQEMLIKLNELQTVQHEIQIFIENMSKFGLSEENVRDPIINSHLLKLKNIQQLVSSNLENRNSLLESSKKKLEKKGKMLCLNMHWQLQIENDSHLITLLKNSLENIKQIEKDILQRIAEVEFEGGVIIPSSSMLQDQQVEELTKIREELKELKKSLNSSEEEYLLAKEACRIVITVTKFDNDPSLKDIWEKDTQLVTEFADIVTKRDKDIDTVNTSLKTLKDKMREQTEINKSFSSSLMELNKKLPEHITDSNEQVDIVRQERELFKGFCRMYVEEAVAEFKKVQEKMKYMDLNNLSDLKTLHDEIKNGTETKKGLDKFVDEVINHPKLSETHYFLEKDKEDVKAMADVIKDKIYKLNGKVNKIYNNNYRLAIGLLKQSHASLKTFCNSCTHFEDNLTKIMTLDKELSKIQIPEVDDTRELKLVSLETIRHDLKQIKLNILTRINDLNTERDNLGQERGKSDEVKHLDQLILTISKEKKEVKGKHSKDPRVELLDTLEKGLQSKRDEYVNIPTISEGNTGEYFNIKINILSKEQFAKKVVNEIRDRVGNDKLDMLSDNNRNMFIQFFRTLLKPLNHFIRSCIEPFSPSFFANRVEKNVSKSIRVVYGNLKAIADAEANSSPPKLTSVTTSNQ